MSAAAIIHIIQGLSLEEQNFVVEQILKLRQENEQKQTEFAEIGTDYVPSKKVVAISAAPKEYMTIEKFQAKANLTKILNERGGVGVPQTLEQLKSSVESAEKQYEMGLGKSNEEIFNKYEKWL